MSNILDIECKSALQFFGTVTASISHEINNVLAIINENAGLLEDFALMADKGQPIDPKRLKALAGKIATQIQRADSIVKNMNKLAHSVDTPVKRINLNDLIELMIALAMRFASMRGVSLERNTSKNPVFITTNDFFLENLLWLCLVFFMDAAGHDKVVTLNAEEVEDHVVIRLSRLDNLKNVLCSGSAGFQDGGMLGILKGELNINTEEGEVSLILPKNINH